MDTVESYAAPGEFEYNLMNLLGWWQRAIAFSCKINTKLQIYSFTNLTIAIKKCKISKNSCPSFSKETANKLVLQSTSLTYCFH